MEFRDYAAKETAALFSRLLVSQAEASVLHLQSLRDALDVASRGIEAGGTATPQIDQDIQELIRRLNSAAGTAARAASQRVQKDMQATLDGVNGELQAQRDEGARLTAALADAATREEQLRADLRTETERAEAVDRDLDAAIEAHALVDGQRLEAETTVRQLTSAKASLEQDLRQLQGALDTTVAENARLSGDLDAVRLDLGRVNETLVAERTALSQARDEVQAALDGVRGELSAEREENARISTSLAENQAYVEMLQADLAEVQAKVEALGADVQRETERAEAADRDLDAAIEAHGLVDAARVEAEAAARQHLQARTTTEKELADARTALDAANAQASRLGMQLDANVAENRTLAADLGAAQAELNAARAQREATTTQLEATRARVQTLERNQQAREEQVRQLETSLREALQAEARARELVDSAELDRAPARVAAQTPRVDPPRLGPLFETSARAVDDLAQTTTIADLLAALVRQLSTEFSRVALFRMKANRLEGEHQVGFDLTTDVSKLVIPLSVDSVITRAATSGAFAHLTGSELQDSSRVPFGGTPTSALALPITFQGETLAVVYADSNLPEADLGSAAQEASVGFAKLMVRTTAVLLMRLSQELKTLNELRDYAAMLLQEAQEMYGADVQADKSATERKSRLKDTIECARQLYAQRAALEGSAAALLFDDRITAVLEGDPITPFALDLAEVVGSSGQRVETRRTAEAS